MQKKKKKKKQQINCITHLVNTHTQTQTMTQRKTTKNFISYQISKTIWNQDRQVDTLWERVKGKEGEKSKTQQWSLYKPI